MKNYFMEGKNSLTFMQRSNHEESETSESTGFVPLAPQMGKLRLTEVKRLTQFTDLMTKLEL